MVGFVSFLSIAAGLAITYLVAREMARIAEEKGFPESKYFWYCMLLGIFGCLIVIALPDRRSGQGRLSGYSDIALPKTASQPRFTNDDLPKL